MVTRGGGGSGDTPIPDLITSALGLLGCQWSLTETRPDMIPLFFFLLLLLRPSVCLLQQKWRAAARGRPPPPTLIRDNLAVAGKKSLAPAPLCGVVPLSSLVVDVQQKLMTKLHLSLKN